MIQLKPQTIEAQDIRGGGGPMAKKPFNQRLNLVHNVALLPTSDLNVVRVQKPIIAVENAKGTDKAKVGFYETTIEQKEMTCVIANSSWLPWRAKSVGDTWKGNKKSWSCSRKKSRPD